MAQLIIRTGNRRVPCNSIVEEKIMSKKLPRGIRFRSDGRYEGRFQYEGEIYFVYDKTLKNVRKSSQI